MAAKRRTAMTTAAAESAHEIDELKQQVAHLQSRLNIADTSLGLAKTKADALHKENVGLKRMRKHQREINGTMFANLVAMLGAETMARAAGETGDLPVSLKCGLADPKADEAALQVRFHGNEWTVIGPCDNSLALAE